MTERMTYRDIEFTVGQEEYVYESPRECGCLTKMYFWHKRYNLGDKHNYESIKDVYVDLFKQCVMSISKDDVRSVLLAVIRNPYGREDYMDMIHDRKLPMNRNPYNKEKYRYDHLYNLEEDLLKSDDVMEKVLEVLESRYVFKNIYMYDHSGITINTSGFGCRWDSGQVGIVFVSKEDIAKEFGKDADIEKKASEVIESEIKVYDQYISGDIWYYTIDAEDFESSLGWIYGYDNCIQEAKDTIDHICSTREKTAAS